MNDLATPIASSKTTKITLYKAHKASVGYWSIHAEIAVGTGAIIVIHHAKSSTAKPVEQIIPVKGKNIGRSNETTPFQQAQLEVQSRINKQLDKGYTYEVPELGAVVTNTLGTLRPMKATALQDMKEDIIDWSCAYVQPKLDGHHGMYKKDNSHAAKAIIKDGVLYSSTGKRINLPHIYEAIEALGLSDLPLDGELYQHGKTLQEIGSLIKRPREESKQLSFYVYDLVMPTSFEERFLGILASRLSATEGVIRLVKTEKVTCMAEAKALQAYWVENHYEGAILRHGKNGYEDGIRSTQAVKLKDYQDAEFEIIGAKKGKPYIRTDEETGETQQYERCVYICQTENGEVFDALAPGSMYEKHQAWVDREEAIGELLTVKFFCYSKDNIPQQPVALRIREDI